MASPPIYTHQLVLRAGLFTPTALYTAPPGYLTVVTCIAAVTGLNPPPVYWSLTELVTGAKFAAGNHPGGSPQGTQDLYVGRWAFEPGENWQFDSDGSSWDLCITGFLLALP